MAGDLVPDVTFQDSRALRIYCNKTRQILHRAAMELHMAGSELEAALRPVAVPGLPNSRGARHRRARRVARNLSHAGECLVAGAAGTVRTWAVFRAEYLGANDKTPVRGRRQTFQVVPE